jgi:ribokinase
MGQSFTTIPGGKGANQAVAAARLGIETEMVGRVGGDRFGQDLLTSLQANGVGCDRVFVDPTIHSGVAMIAVDHQAENHIIVISGANGAVDDSDVQRLREVLSPNSILLLQLEIPLPMVVAAAEVAKAQGARVILDPAPARSDLPHELYSLLNILTPNQVEASELVGFPVNSIETAREAAIALRQRGVDTVIVKLGKQGAICATADETFAVPAFLVRAIDTVAAGDAFNGGLATALAEGQPLQTALTWASAVAALSTTQAGAQPSMPTREALEIFLKAQSTDLV